MASKKQIQSVASLNLKLTPSEWLMVRQLTTVEPEIVERVAGASKDRQAIPFTVDELESLVRHVAAELYQTGEDREWNCLEQIYEKIHHLLDAHTDEP